MMLVVRTAVVSCQLLMSWNTGHPRCSRVMRAACTRTSKPGPGKLPPFVLVPGHTESAPDSPAASSRLHPAEKHVPICAPCPTPAACWADNRYVTPVCTYTPLHLGACLATCRSHRCANTVARRQPALPYIITPWFVIGHGPGMHLCLSSVGVEPEYSWWKGAVVGSYIIFLVVIPSSHLWAIGAFCS